MILFDQCWTQCAMPQHRHAAPKFENVHFLYTFTFRLVPFLFLANRFSVLYFLSRVFTISILKLSFRINMAAAFENFNVCNFSECLLILLQKSRRMFPFHIQMGVSNFIYIKNGWKWKKITYFCGNNPVKWMNSKLGAHSVTNSHCSNCIHLVVNILPTFGNIERNAHSSFCHLNVITLFSMPNVRDYAVIFLELAQVIRFGTLAKMVIVLWIKRPL